MTDLVEIMVRARFADADEMELAKHFTPAAYAEMLRQEDKTLTALHNAGFRMVPVEPTEAMLKAADEQLDWGPAGYDNAPQGPATPESAYRIMLKAAEQELPDWEDLRGRAPDATGELSSEAFVRELRDAWEQD